VSAALERRTASIPLRRKVLITKFGRVKKKSEYLILTVFRRDRLEDLKIKDVLRPRKILEGGEERMEKNSKSEVEVTKIGGSDFEN
jgi:hypothetical protein